MRDAVDRPLFGAELLPVSRTHPAREVRIRYRGEELVLAPTLLTDVETIASAVNASVHELRRFMPWAHHTPSPHSTIDRLRRCEADYFAGKEFVMGLFRERPGAPRELLTGIGLHPRVALNPSALEVGYWTATPHARRGYATLAVRCATVYAFDKFGATRVQVMCDEANTASRGVIEKCGFAFEGVLRNLTTDPDPAHRAAGLIHTGRCRMYALFPDTFAAVPWAAEARAGMRYANLLGYE